MEAIQKAIEKLEVYFDHFELRPPAAQELRDNLKNFYPNISEEVLQFYTYCNGFNANLKSEWNYGVVLSLERIYELMELSRTGENPLFTVLFPIRKDGSWNFDCVFFNEGVGKGSVVFWDNGTSAKPDYPLAGSLTTYFEFLSDYLITSYKPNGEVKFEYDIDNPDMEEYPWPFDDDWIAEKDKVFSQLIRNKKYEALFD